MYGNLLRFDETGRKAELFISYTVACLDRNG